MKLDSIVVDEGQFVKWWKELKSIGVINRDWTQNDLAQLRGYRKYVRGELVEDKITIHPERYDYEFWAPVLQR